MRKFIIALFLVASFTVMAEEMSRVESSGSWVYLYNAYGSKYKTLSSASVGTIVGYSSSFFVSTDGNWIYLYDSNGKRYKTLSKNSVGKITGVAGDTFTSRSGSWIHTWNKDGKKINTRPAR